MDNIIRYTTKLALHLVRPYVTPDAAVIDATCGNGHDTLALAEMDPARIYAFDIQGKAVRATTELLQRHGYSKSIAAGQFMICCMPHEQMGTVVPRCACTDPGDGAGAADCAAPVRAVIFNLGYLPGGDKERTTRTDSTLAAVRAAMELIAPDGVICITMYSGHPEGKREKTALLDFASALDAGKWHTAYVSMPNQKHDPPEILLLTRKQ